MEITKTVLRHNKQDRMFRFSNKHLKMKQREFLMQIGKKDSHKRQEKLWKLSYPHSC